MHPILQENHQLTDEDVSLLKKVFRKLFTEANVYGFCIIPSLRPASSGIVQVSVPGSRDKMNARLLSTIAYTGSKELVGKELRNTCGNNMCIYPKHIRDGSVPYCGEHDCSCDPSCLEDDLVQFKDPRPIEFLGPDNRGLQNVSLGDYIKTLDAVIQKCHFNNTGCWISHLAPDHDGYCRVTCKQTHIMVHVLSYMVYHQSYNSNLHVSHLCRNTQCLNPEHLTQETPDDSDSRKGCSGFPLCNHNPWCMSRNLNYS